MEEIIMLIGFLLAAYAVVGNDAIQTLGTFLSSNSNRPWWILWIYSSTILVGVVLYGIYIEQDISYGKFTGLFGEGGYPTLTWWFILPPVVLLIITQFGIPVSTTFLILSIFSAKAIPSMIIKSATGYALAFGIAILVYMLISRLIEKHFIRSYTGELPSTPWIVAQWLSTGFLWSMWLMQDMVNIFVYFYEPITSRPEQAQTYLLVGTVALVIFQAILFYFRGGAIQKIVTSKTNTVDVRSATIIDFIYGIILLTLKGPIPLSTTWVFIGLLAGREFAINARLGLKSTSAVGKIVLSDLLKVIAGLVVSVLIILILNYVRG